MKTLDEVIQELGNMMPETCDECPFVCLAKSEDDCPLFIALHYLKEYQEGKKLYDAIQDYHWKIKEKIETPWHDNPSLTWEELKRMEGKPVWVETKNCGNHWYVIDCVDENIMLCCGRFGERLKYFRDCMEVGLWQAYRKERA